MKTSISFAIAISLMSFILFAGCKKVWDHIDNNPGELKLCNIKKITDPNNIPQQNTFSYNSAGDPSFVTTLDPAEETPNLLFRYDAKGRLSVFAGTFSNVDSLTDGSYGFYHRYFYKNDRTVIDTNYYLGVTKGVFGEYYASDIRVNVYQLDNKGRIIKTTRTYLSRDWVTNEWVPTLEVPADVFTYSYDSRGNLVNSSLPSSAYDNKINFRQTNKVWMFISSDYSVNNRFKSTSYNCYGLPLKVNLPASTKITGIPYINLSGDASIEYMCDCDANSTHK